MNTTRRGFFGKLLALFGIGAAAQSAPAAVVESEIENAAMMAAMRAAESRRGVVVFDVITNFDKADKVRPLMTKWATKVYEGDDE